MLLHKPANLRMKLTNLTKLTIVLFIAFMPML